MIYKLFALEILLLMDLLNGLHLFPWSFTTSYRSKKFHLIMIFLWEYRRKSIKFAWKGKKENEADKGEGGRKAERERFFYGKMKMFE